MESFFFSKKKFFFFSFFLLFFVFETLLYIGNSIASGQIVLGTLMNPLLMINPLMFSNFSNPLVSIKNLKKSAEKLKKSKLESTNLHSYIIITSIVS